MTRALQCAHLLLILAIVALLGLTAWGAMGLNRAAITLLQDVDHAVTQPLDPQVVAQAKAIFASAQAFAADAADLMHAVAHPTKGQIILNTLAKFAPKLF